MKTCGFTETSGTGLLSCTCTATACTIVVPTDNVRYVGGALPEFTYALNSFTGKIEVKCASALAFTSPSPLTTSTVSFKLNDGTKSIVMDAFTTSDPNCPPVSYTSSTLPTGVTQPGCPTPPDASLACRSLTLVTSSIGQYIVTFTVAVEDGKSTTSS
jgi:hypothetical protein